MKQYTVAIAGLGGRGLHTYAKFQDKHPERMKIVAVADIDAEKVRYAAQKYAVPNSGRYISAEEMLAEDKLADVMIIATQDAQHRTHALAALGKGYDLLLEKPVAITADACLEIRDAAIKANKLVTVGHVLRYTAFYRKIKEIIDSGVIGRPVTLAALENVSFWHQAHSFVRGNWRNAGSSSPMILQKCCHDFDILAWLTGKKILSVSSFGSLTYFVESNAPEGSSARCCDCKYKDTCPYSAYRIYFDEAGVGYNSGNREWPLDVLAEEPTKEKLMAAIETGPYGRCVFRCDNDVVDHQIVNMQMEDDVTVSLTMTAFTAVNTRNLKVMGTLGEIVADQNANTVTVTPFGGESKVYDITTLTDDLSGHGGGDMRLMAEMFDALDRRGKVSSSIEDSIASHIAALAAEESRLNGGAVIALSDFERSVKEGR